MSIKPMNDHLLVQRVEPKATVLSEPSEDL